MAQIQKKANFGNDLQKEQDIVTKEFGETKNVEARDLIKGLIKLGFESSEGGNHSKLVRFDNKNDKYQVVIIPRHNIMKPGLLGSILKDILDSDLYDSKEGLRKLEKFISQL